MIPIRPNRWREVIDTFDKGYLATVALCAAAWPQGFHPHGQGHTDSILFAAEVECGIFSRVANLTQQGRTTEAVQVLRDAFEVVRTRDPVLWETRIPSESELRDLYRAAGWDREQARVDADRYKNSAEGQEIARALKHTIAARQKASAA